MEMKCELHNEVAELRNSHIIPKFVYRWMKKTGTGRLRQRRVLNTPLQDGIKKNMLCTDCEGKFSKLETWFNNNVFSKFQEESKFEIDNSKILNDFCISISWRIIKYFKDDGNEYKHKNCLDEAELEWCNYLLNNLPIAKFNNHHLLFIDHDYYPSFLHEIYFTRNVDIDIAESDSKCFIFAKFGKFIIISEITGMPKESIVNCNLREELFLNSNYQGINDPDIFEFFQSRIDNLPEFKDLSKTQQEKNDEYFQKNKERIIMSKYYQTMKKYTK